MIVTKNGVLNKVKLKLKFFAVTAFLNKTPILGRYHVDVIPESLYHNLDFVQSYSMP